MKRTHNTTWELIWLLAITDFKLRYSGSVLGFVWAFLKPLLIFLVLNFVFSNIFANNDPYYSVKLLLGLVLFNFFAEGTSVGMVSLVSKSYILKKIALRHWLIVLSSTLHVLLSFLINICIVVIFMIAAQLLPSLGDVLWFLVYIMLTYLLILAFSLVTSVLYVKIRDLNQIWEVLLNILFYATPIIYPLSIIPEKYHWILFLNPLTFLLQHSKQALIDHQFTSPIVHMVMVAIILLTTAVCFWIFNRLTRKINERL